MLDEISKNTTSTCFAIYNSVLKTFNFISDYETNEVRKLYGNKNDNKLFKKLIKFSKKEIETELSRCFIGVFEPTETTSSKFKYKDIPSPVCIDDFKIVEFKLEPIKVHTTNITPKDSYIDIEIDTKKLDEINKENNKLFDISEKELKDIVNNSFLGAMFTKLFNGK